MEAQLLRDLAKAENLNSTLFLRPVPNGADLPPIAPAPLVKPSPPEDLKPNKESLELFALVVPDTRWGGVVLCGVGRSVMERLRRY